ncbi:MAG: serine hydrolase domain-containing protein [Chloroherpetonaceae bacterium]|nr:serine hydrolase domain-containing protein [Chloroherpetonaceae bacterium]
MTKILLFLVFAFLMGSVTYGQKINKSKIDILLKGAEQTHSEAVIIYKDNNLVIEKYFGIGQANNKIESMSCTKSIVGLAVACLLNDKLIDSLDIPVSTYFPEWKQGQKQFITLRHLLNMTSGLQNNPNASIEIYPSHDFVQLALTAELSYKPGEVWAYNNKALNLMAGVIKKITGKRMDNYIGERLFRPLGITDFSWSLDSVGNPHVMSGCQIKPMDFAKIGLLLLNKGRFNNEVVIAEKYITEVITPCKQYQGYGMLWWIDYEKTVSVIDDEIINELTKAEVPQDFVQKVISMKGTYATNDEYYAKVQNVFGKNPWGYINETLGSNLRLRKKEFSGNITYRADGYLGNYIIVDPKNKIVAIRMISHQSFENENDNFFDFGKQVLNLTE